jgi:DNA-binding transcriptional ArsR family regulator
VIWKIGRASVGGDARFPRNIWLGQAPQIAPTCWATFRLKKGLQNITPYGVMLLMDQLSDVLTAISHPSRRAIIGQLANGPARFLDVAKPFDTALNAVTKHLKLLERAGLIERRKQGREVFISFRGEPLRQVAGWVHEYERFWNERLDQFEQYFKGKKEKSSQTKAASKTPQPHTKEKKK